MTANTKNAAGNKRASTPVFRSISDADEHLAPERAGHLQDIS
jgi:hypothetical protein